MEIVSKIIKLFIEKPQFLAWLIVVLIFLFFACREIKKSKEDYNKHKKVQLNIILRILDYIWRKKYLWLIFFVGLIGAFFLLFTSASRNDHLIFYTLLVIFWYSRETMDLKRNSSKEIEQLKKQFITSIRPYLRLQKKAGENKLQLVNEGKGVAVNLRSVYKKDNQQIELPYITAMAAAPNSVTEGLTPTSLGIDFDSDEDCLIEIEYEDIEGRKYCAIFKRNAEYNDKFEIIKQKKLNNET